MLVLGLDARDLGCPIMRANHFALAVALACTTASCSQVRSSAPSPAPATSVATTSIATTAVPATPLSDTAGPTATSATAGPDLLTILVTNDDGIDSPGIAAIATALVALEGVEVIVVAPADNQSGTSDTTSPGQVGYQEVTATNGLRGYAVDGTPADAVNIALDQLQLRPDLVVSGTNAGQNVGPAVPISGTVGAARTAARRAIPAIAVSGAPDYSNAADAVALVIAEITANRDSYGYGTATDHTVVNINVPTCAAGAVRGIVDVVYATDYPAGWDASAMDCASTATDPADDMVAMMIGFASRSIVPADL